MFLPCVFFCNNYIEEQVVSSSVHYGVDHLLRPSYFSAEWLLNSAEFAE